MPHRTTQFTLLNHLSLAVIVLVASLIALEAHLLITLVRHVFITPAEVTILLGLVIGTLSLHMAEAQTPTTLGSDICILKKPLWLKLLTLLFFELILAF